MSIVDYVIRFTQAFKYALYLNVYTNVCSEAKTLSYSALVYNEYMHSTKNWFFFFYLFCIEIYSFLWIRL